MNTVNTMNIEGKIMTELSHISNTLPQLKFDKKRSRVQFCPCGKDNKDSKFAPFVGYENKGYCHSCGETFLPELSKVEQSNTTHPTRNVKPKVQPQKQIDFLPETLFVKQLNNGKNLYSENHFIQWLGNNQRGEYSFDDKTINHLIEIYFLGNSKKYKGWVLFPYIDINGKIRDIKAMDYNPITGKRIATKNGDCQNRCYFIGKEILKNPEANTIRCFYGEHLLQGNTKLVRIFESEATATYTAPFYPNSVCIATGGNNGCKWTEMGKCSVLQGHNVILYPDIDAHDSWEQKAEILRTYGISVQVSQLIKDNAIKFAQRNGIDYSELVKLKYDLRDILQHKKLSDFLKVEDKETAPTIQPKVEVQKLEHTEPAYKNTAPNNNKNENWEQEIAKLQNYFAGITLPSHPIKLNDYSTVSNCSKFIESHLDTVKANNGKPTFSPYLHRLQQIKQLLTTNLN